MSAAGVVGVVLLLLVLVLTVIGTGLPYTRSVEYKDAKNQDFSEISLFYTKTRVTVSGNKIEQTTWHRDNDNIKNCHPMRDSLGAAAAFAFISIVLALVAFILGIVSVAGKIPAVAAIGAALATSVTLIIAWAISVSLYTRKFCGNASSKELDWKLGVGTILLIIASGLGLLAAAAIIPLFLAATGGSTVHPSNNSDNQKKDDKKDDKKDEDKKKKDDEDKKKKDDDEKKKKDEDEKKKKKEEEDKKKKDDEQKKKDEEQKKKEADKKKKQWQDLRDRLPRKKVPDQNEKRNELFKKFDKQSNGYLSYAEAKDGTIKYLELNKLTNDLDAILLRAFNAAKDARKGKGKKADEQNDYIERVEFRLYLCYIYDYFELNVMFDEIDTSDDRRVTVDEFKQAVPLIKSWGLNLDNPEATFKQIDKSGGGVVSFDEFAEWAAKNHLDMDGDAENDD